MSTVTSEAQSAQEDHPVPPRRRARRRWWQALLLVVLLVVAGVVAVSTGLVRFGRGAEPASATSNAPTATALVERRQLTAQTILNGTLVYSDKFDIVNRIDGTLTDLPAAGDTIEHGKPLYWIDAKPVLFLQGDIPAYRELAAGTMGADVRQLNAELDALGYADKRSLSPSSETFGKATAVAVKQLQKTYGLEQTGKLGLGQVIFLPIGAIRVSKTDATVGSPAPTGVLEETTSTQRVVTVAVDTAQASMIKMGDAVSLTLPDRTTTAGKVKSIGAVATKSDSGLITVDMLVELVKPAEAGGLDQAPVQLGVTSAVADNVLAVPVNALLALSGGRYAVEVVLAGDVRKLYEVKLGLFDDSAGMVEVKGEGLKAGQRIVVPAA